MTFDPRHTLALLAERHGIAFDAALLPTSHRFTRADGPELHYLRWGGDGPAVLLLHGGALTAHTWDLVCLALGARYRCIAVDLRGHGESAWADRYGIDAGVDDVRALLDALALDPVHLVGMSLGGNIAGHAAPTLGAALRSLTLVDIGPGINRDGTTVMRRFLADASTHASVDALVGAALAVSPRSDPDLLRYRYHYMTSVQPDGWRWRHDTRHKPDYGQMTRKLAELEQLTDAIACPVLVAVGARSRVLSEAAAQRFAARFANGRAVPIADAGHNVQEDNPRALADALAAHFVAADAHAG